MSIYCLLNTIRLYSNKSIALKYNNPLIIFVFYLLNIVLKVFLIYIGIEVVQILVRFFNDFFLEHNLFLFDFLIPNLGKQFLLSKGLYFSVFFSLVFIILITLFDFPNLKSKLSIDFFVIIIILFFGICVSMFSIANLVFHFISSDDLTSFYKNEQNNHLLLLRISSIRLFYEVVIFLFRHFRKFTLVRGYSDLAYGKLSPFYISQIGFYILVILTLYYTQHLHINSLFVRLLDFVLFFIIDDWSVIYDYYMKFKKMLFWHFYKLFFGNIAIYLSASIFFIQIKNYWLLIIFTTFCLLLVIYRYKAFGAAKIEII